MKPAENLRLVLASNNAKKLSELSSLLQGLQLQLVSQSELGITEAEEPHITFIENALAKARHAAAAAGCAAIADDSGLCVDALGGSPGVISAHYAPLPDPIESGIDREALRKLQDAANNRLLLQNLNLAISEADLANAKDRPGAGRSASFVCTLVAIRHAQDPQPLVAVGRWQGHILEQPRGELGFGYDPLMFIPELQMTVAEMDAATKNQHSHRARAMAQMQQWLSGVWGL